MFTSWNQVRTRADRIQVDLVALLNSVVSCFGYGGNVHSYEHVIKLYLILSKGGVKILTDITIKLSAGDYISNMFRLNILEITELYQTTKCVFWLFFHSAESKTYYGRKKNYDLKIEQCMKKT